MQVPARPPAAAAMAGATIDKLSGGRFLFGFGPSGPQVSEGWYGVPYAKPWGRTREYIEVVREIIAREGPLEHHGDALRPAAAGRRGQGAEAEFPPAAQRDPGLRRRDRAQIGADGGRRSPTAGSRSSSPSTTSRRPGASTSRPGFARRPGGRAPTSRSRPRCPVRDRRRPGGGEEHGQGGLAPLSRGDGVAEDQLLRRPGPPLRLRRRRRRGPAALPGRRPRRRLRGDARTRSSRPPRWSGPRPRSPNGWSASPPPASTA